jgi:hypothetical protein
MANLFRGADIDENFGPICCVLGLKHKLRSGEDELCSLSINLTVTQVHRTLVQAMSSKLHACLHENILFVNCACSYLHLFYSPLHLQLAEINVRLFLYLEIITA